MDPVPHPISSLDTYDTVVTTDRGAYLGLVIASPLRDDEVSRARLKKKIDLYTGYFQSPQYLERCGTPSLDRSRVYISIHAGSAPSMLELVESYDAHFRDFGITLVVKISS